MPFGGLLTVGLISAGTSIAGGLMGSSASKSAAAQQAKSAQDALDFQKQVFNQQQTNQQPFLDSGKTSLSKLMEGISNGTFGAGAAFQAPTAEQARATPGYQFNLAEGDRAIERGQAAAGGAFTGGTLKALQGRSTDLANSTYQQTFQNAMSGYQANLANQQQQFGELFAPAQLGENAVASINNTGTQVSQNVGNLMTQQGNAQAAGTVGSANAITGGLTGATNNLTQAMTLGKLLGNGGAAATTNPSWMTNGIG